MHVAVIDVGKPDKNLGWAIAGPSPTEGTDLDQVVVETARRLRMGPVALGFEAPMYVPMRDAPGDLTKARRGECVDGVNRPFSAGAGSTVLVIGTVVVPYVLRNLRKIVAGSLATLDYKSFFKAPSGLLLFEAFVTNQKKKHESRHVEDAGLAAQYLFRSIESGIGVTSAITEPACLNILAAMMLRTGWSEDIRTLSQESLVVRV